MAANGKINPDELFVELLTAKRYCIVRHILFWLLVLCLGIGNMYMGANESDRIIWVALITGVIISPILLNVYVLVPKLLLRNRPYKYLGITFIILLLAMIVSNCIQYLFNIPSFIYKDDYGSMIKYMVLSNISTIISFSFIIAGTTSIIILQLWLRERQRTTLMEDAVNRAELDMLKSQINPHFLFNMLNNAIVQVRETPAEGRETILKLKEMLDYQLSTSRAPLIALSGDINFLNDLLHLEKLRRDRFDYRIMVIGGDADVRVPPLLFIPFVENAIKHGNDNTKESYILLVFNVKGDKLHFFCSNSLPSHGVRAAEGGLGLKNIERRLQLIYGKKFILNTGSTGLTYNVNLTIGL